MMANHSNNAGFSLLEVLVALTILALALGALLGIFSGSAQGTGLAVRTRQAVDLAQSRVDLMDATGIYAIGSDAGREDGGFQWSEAVSTFDAGATADPRWTPVKVTVQVSWQDGARQRSVTLQTLRMVARS